MEQAGAELVIRIHGITSEQRDQLRDHLLQESEGRGLQLEAEVSGDVLGDLNYETILVICTMVQTGVEVVKAIHAILEPWIKEQHVASKGTPAKEQEIKAEIVVDGTVVTLPEEVKSDQPAD